MSDVVEKTLTALPGLLSLDSQSGAGKLSSTSKLGHLIRGITELTSKHEEEKLIKHELAAIKDQVSSPNNTMRQMKEVMVRAIYCEMLGYEAPFSYIHAIKLAQQGSALDKRVGYLAVSLFLNEGHELLLLLVNTVLKDLQSTNLIEVCMALTVVSQMFPKDMIPAILPLVEEKLTHPKEMIRRKAVLALYKFYLIAPNQVQHIHGRFRKALCDKDPGVMTASLHIYLQMIKERPDGYRDLAGSFVGILRQVVGGKLPPEFSYRSVPAPWLQITLLQILALLGKDHHSTSELMYEVLDESLRRAEMNHNITYAILYECVRAIYTIHPKPELLEKAAKCIGSFVLSPKINLKYLGLKALAFVVQRDANLALQHQMTIIECLDHPDHMIKRQTLELLFRITNGQNVAVIVEKMLDFLRLSNHDYSAIDLVGKIAEVAEKFAPSSAWFIQTMNGVFLLGGDAVQPHVPNAFLRLLSQGFGSAEEDLQLRRSAVDSYVSVLQGAPESLPQRFLQVISWVLGEYSHLRAGLDPVLVLGLLVRVLARRRPSAETRCWVLSALTKLSGGRGGAVRGVTERYAASLDTALRQKAQELHTLSHDPALHARVLAPHRRAHRLEVDSSLSFLDGFVAEALAAGAAPYQPPHQRQAELAQEKALSLEPYGLSLPVSLSSCSGTDRPSPTLPSLSSGLSGHSPDPARAATLKLEGVRRVWGKEGYLAQQKEEAAEETAQAEVPSPLRSPRQQSSAERSPGQTPTPEPDPLKQQLASSLFVGLGSQNSVCLMGKTEPTPQRFRWKPKDRGSSSGASEMSSDSSHSSRGAVDSLLGGSPSDPTAVPFHGGVSPTEATSTRRTPDLGTRVTEAAAGGRSGATVAPPPPLARNGVAAVEPDDGGPEESRLSPHLPAGLSGLSRSDIAPLCSGPSLALSACSVSSEDALLLVVFLSNVSDSAVRQVRLQLTCGELEITRVTAGVPDELGGGAVAACQYSLVMTRPSTHAELAGTLSYQTARRGEPHTAHFSRQLCLTDFIRPLVVSTEAYGRMWLSFSHDTKQNLKLVQPDQDQNQDQDQDRDRDLDLDPLTATLNALKEKLQLHVVDIIGSEGLVACRLLQGPPCLMHCRVHDNGLAAWLRSPAPELPDCLLYHYQKTLQER